jgi:hypothetical protein
VGNNSTGVTQKKKPPSPQSSPLRVEEEKSSPPRVGKDKKIQKDKMVKLALLKGFQAGGEI